MTGIDDNQKYRFIDHLIDRGITEDSVAVCREVFDDEFDFQQLLEEDRGHDVFRIICIMLIGFKVPREMLVYVFTLREFMNQSSGHFHNVEFLRIDQAIKWQIGYYDRESEIVEWQMKGILSC